MKLESAFLDCSPLFGMISFRAVLGVAGSDYGKTWPLFLLLKLEWIDDDCFAGLGELPGSSFEPG